MEHLFGRSYENVAQNWARAKLSITYTYGFVFKCFTTSYIINFSPIFFTYLWINSIAVYFIADNLSFLVHCIRLSERNRKRLQWVYVTQYVFLIKDILTSRKILQKQNWEEKKIKRQLNRNVKRNTTSCKVNNWI